METKINLLEKIEKGNLVGLELYCVTTRESEDTSRSCNGGDYTEWEFCVVEQSSGRIVAGYHDTSADFAYCLGCGRYGSCECDRYHPTYDTISDAPAACVEKIDLQTAGQEWLRLRLNRAMIRRLDRQS
jgi:hypothetical protein